ncbi:hypothetical protein FJZ33_00400 [Candidatus Poribacteria bacterium]|nr:hypothetical protein [Candidatus Poribacteria bacterium]
MLEFPQDLIDALVKHDVVLFLGGDAIKHFFLLREESWPERFVDGIAQEINFPNKSRKSFFNVGEYIRDKGLNNWLNRQIIQLYGGKKPRIEPIIVSLAATGQRLAVTTWFDNHFLQALHIALGRKVHPVCEKDHLHYLSSESRTCLVYLFGSANSPGTLVTDTLGYHSCMDRTKLLPEYIRRYLASSPLLFIGYNSSEWFDFEDFYSRLLNIVPDRHSPQNYAICDGAFDEATIGRLQNRHLKIQVVDNVKDYIDQLAQKVLIRQSRSTSPSYSNGKLPEKPYKYLFYYSSEDSGIFFGRQRDIEEIVSLILAHRSLVLFGASGVGKTSLLEAGIAPSLKAKGCRYIRTRVLPDPASALAVALGMDNKGILQSNRWLNILRTIISKENINNIVLIFDQFEEFFSDLSQEIQKTFWKDVELCLQNFEYKVRLVFTIRQESLYLLKEAFPSIPKPYDVIYGIDSLTPREKEEVITLPVKLYNRPWSLKFVERLLEDIDRCPGETAHLSIVLTTLWDERKNSESDLETYARLGGVEEILANYLWGVIKSMPHSEKVEQVLKAFVSPEHRKSQVSIADLIAEARKKDSMLSDEEIQSICNDLISVRLVRTVIGQENLYELSHDVLATEIAEKVTEDEMLSKLAKRRIREAIQNWKVTKHLPNPQEYAQLNEAGNEAALVIEDLLFLCLAAAHNGELVDNWLKQMQLVGGSIDYFYEACADSGSLLSGHELLRHLQHNYSDKYFLYIKKIAKNTKPSLLIHLRDFIEELAAEGHKELLKLRLTLPELHITIPCGKFIMGYNIDQELAIPEHEIYLDEYLIDRFLVTNLDYKRFVDASGHRPPEHWENEKIPYGKEYHPVIRVNWYDAAAYAKWCGKRLPTEAEWEKAAYWDPIHKRKYVYPWGGQFDAGKANYFDSHIGTTSPIGQFSPEGDSPYGVSDMAGNVFEWVLDDSVTPFRPFNTKINPVHITDRENATKMTRGGSYGGAKDQLHCAFRGYERNKLMRDDYVGFRCVSSTNSKHYELMLEQLKQLNE